MGNWSTLKSILWFLPTLISLTFLMFIFNISNKYIKSFLLFLSLMSFFLEDTIVQLHNEIPFGIDIAIYLLILSVLVKFVYKNQEKNLFPKFQYVVGLALLVVIACAMILNFEPVKVHSKFHMIVDFAQFSVPSTLIGYVSFLILNLAVLLFFLNVKSIKLLSFIGQYTFPIFLLHIFILFKLPNLFENKNLAVLLLTLFASIILPILISKVLSDGGLFKYIGMVK